MFVTVCVLAIVSVADSANYRITFLWAYVKHLIVDILTHS